MNQFQFSHAIIPSVLAGILSLFTAVRLWKLRTTSSAVPLALLFISIACWSIGSAIETIFINLEPKIIWIQLQYLGIAWTTVFWLLFCLRYTNKQQPTTASFYLIFSWIPVATIILAFTNQYHNLVWLDLSLSAVRGIAVLNQDYGVWFWINTAYSYALYLAGLFLLIQNYFRTPRGLRQQTQLIILAGFVPGIMNFITLSAGNPFPLLNLTALSFVFMGLIIVFVVFYHRLLDIIPIARDTTIENMRDGIIVIDLKDRIIDINPAAEKIVQASLAEVIGKPAEEMLSDITEWISSSKQGKTPVKIINSGQGPNKKIYVLNQIPLSDIQGSLIGYTIIFHDNTESYILNKNLKDQADRLAVLYEIGKAITSTLEIEDMLELIYTQLSKVITSDAYFVALYQSETHELDVRILIDQGKRYPPTQVDANQGVSSWIIEHKKPLLISDLRKELDHLGVKPILVGDKRLSRSWLGVPLLADEELIGLLAVTSYAPDVFNAADQFLMEQISQQAALSIQNARHYEEVNRQAKLDSLTGVSNHKHFIETLYEETEKALANIVPISLIMLDIDHFKIYNDTYGHIVGDEVLRLTVQAIRSHIKKTDTVGRWGGEEFGIVLPNATITQANMVANRIRRTLSELPLFDIDGQTVPKPTISQGIATIPDHTSNADELVIIADRALYRAKDRGRDQVAVGKPSPIK
jgi:diguanylate cyclase (GGDEF)-like protein/PAS domain S-box-containing protein